jgi:hypothetical protein
MTVPLAFVRASQAKCKTYHKFKVILIFMFSWPAIAILCLRTGNSDGPEPISEATLVCTIRESRKAQGTDNIFYMTWNLCSLGDAWMCYLSHTHRQGAKINFHAEEQTSGQHDTDCQQPRVACTKECLPALMCCLTVKSVYFQSSTDSAVINTQHGF